MVQNRSPNAAFLDAIERVATFAFQPIVDIHTGSSFGFEALLRNVDKLGFDTIQALFDYAWNAGMLHSLDITLRRTAFSQFSRTQACKGAKLFYNIDGRMFESQDYQPDVTAGLLSDCAMDPENLVLELSERYDNVSARHLTEILTNCRKQKFKLALDDFGRGFSEMQMLYAHQPDFIKIDRFFIQIIDEDPKKRLFVSSIVTLSHVLGITVLAEGVETEREFLTCKAVGCDLVQGYFIARPTTEHQSLARSYPMIAETCHKERRQQPTDRILVQNHLTPLQTVVFEDGLAVAVDLVRHNSDQTVFPVLDRDGRPLGLLRRADFTELLASGAGQSSQQDFQQDFLQEFLRQSPIADLHSDVEDILEAYTIGRHGDGILMTENSSYIGFLSTEGLLQVINEKNQISSQDRNALSKLPGNNSIMDFLARVPGMDSRKRHLVFFDFRNLKPFNEAYGFRQGDRAITVFADLLRDRIQEEAEFIGHIGGGDFFASFTGQPDRFVLKLVTEVMQRFQTDMKSFYSPEHRKANGIEGYDRIGVLRVFALLSCCAAILTVPAGQETLSAADLEAAIQTARDGAKTAETGISLVRLDQLGCPAVALA